ncbi:MAG: hypothetical protein J2P43_12755, partial [Candidatus Dormibacteraeota bacterium]|nr:hypothetical protein [Candidatus Dormibacteraeota bacterium]
MASHVQCPARKKPFRPRGEHGGCPPVCPARKKTLPPTGGTRGVSPRVLLRLLTGRPEGRTLGTDTTTTSETIATEPPAPGGRPTVEKEKALSTAVQQIERSYGKGAIMKLGEAAATRDVSVIPTGALPLDLALGVGGVPRGRVVELYGPESAGKTTVALHVVAEAQRTGGVAAFVDAEHALDPIYAARIGVNIDELLISQPDTGEQALEIVEVLVRSGAVDVVVVDSVAALVPKAEIEGEMGDSHVGLQARLMSQALRKLTAA